MLLPSSAHRLIWTNELHQRFVEAVEATGGLDKALPKAIMKARGPSFGCPVHFL